MKRIIILTGSEIRHVFFRKFLAMSEGIEVIHAYCEGTEKSLRTIVEKQNINNDMRLQHLIAREQSEKDFFALFIESINEQGNPIYLPKGHINLPEYTEQIISAEPDLLISYGCSIIKSPLLNQFSGRFVNVHLGLSPYYRGSGTNYWPLVNKEPEFVGATYMFIDEGIDTGEIIHQTRANYQWGDTPSQIGNRLILEMAHNFKRLIINFDDIERMQQPETPKGEKVYRNKDYSEESVRKLYQNFSDGMIPNYLREKNLRCDNAPLLVNPALECLA